MYFAEGSSTRLSARNGSGAWETADMRDGKTGGILDMALSKDGEFLAAVKRRVLMIWTARPRVLVAKCIRAQITVDEDGSNWAVFWSHDSSTVVVVTDRGFLHFYNLVADAPSSLSLAFPSTHSHTMGPGEGNGVASISLSFKMALEIDAGIMCGIGIENEALFCTRDSPSLLSLSWAGLVNDSDTIPLADLAFLVDPDSSLEQMCTNDSMDLFVFIDQAGRGYLAQRLYEEMFEDDSGDDTSEKEFSDNEYQFPNAQSRYLPSYAWAGLCFFDPEDTTSGHKAKATSLAINSRFLLVAVGDASGSIFIYKLSSDRYEVTFSHELKHTPDTSSHSKRGPVSSMSWTSCGNALAVGWKNGGVSVWSAFGHQLFETRLDDQMEDLDKSRIDSYFFGVKRLFWGHGNVELFVLSSSAAEQDIYAIKFWHSPLTACPVTDSNSVCLVGNDHLLIRRGINDGFDAISLDMSEWESIQIPVAYIAKNWPIQYAATNKSGGSIAIAGKQGLAYHNCVTNRWKLFGIQGREQSFSVRGGLLWFEDMIVAAALNATETENQILIFSKDENMDFKCSHIEIAPLPIVLLCSTGSVLMCLMNDGVLRRFSIVPTEATIMLKLEQQIVLDFVIDILPAVQSITWNQGTNSVLILCAGVLSVLNETSTDMWTHTEVADKVEYARIAKNISGIESILCLFRCSELQLSFPADGFTSESVLRSPVALKADFYPLAILFSRGILIGLECVISSSIAMQCVLFKMESKSLLFLGAIARFFLNAGSPESAFQFMRNYRRFKYFSHALEMLLHTVAEDDMGSKLGESDATLPTVIQFLKRFPTFLDIVALCARKSDVSIWESFFQVAGNPQDLFKECLGLGYLRTATSYLIIIQTLEPAAVSIQFAVDLLKKALEMEDFKTAKELIRFYKSINGYSGDIMNTLKHSIPGSLSRLNLENENNIHQPVDPDASNIFYLEVVMNRHAKHLLASYRIRDLRQFTNLFSIPLTTWLHTERNRAAQIRNLSDAFSVTHQQFGLPFPEEFDEKEYTPEIPSVKKRMSLPSGFNPSHELSGNGTLRLDISAARRVHAGPKSAHVTSFNEHAINVTPKVFDEIRTLAHCVMEAGCHQWSLLLYSILFDVRCIVNILQGAGKEHAASLVELLNFSSEGYKALGRKIQEIIKQ
ncbi:hypothetical protein HDU80_011272 [Chytriomyces hyalinus]|nr:hypothetical protein HDU80_011272 [Chytriomyces hyalinus]